MPKRDKNDSNILYYVTVALIFGAIILVAILNRVTNKNAGSDVRARASVTGGLRITGTVGTVNIGSNAFTLLNVMFDGDATQSKKESLGDWTITPPPDFDLATLSPGSEVVVSANPTTFLVTSHTAAANKIDIVR